MGWFDCFKKKPRLKHGDMIQTSSGRPGKVIDDYIPKGCSYDKYGRYIVCWDDSDIYQVVNQSTIEKVEQ